METPGSITAATTTTTAATTAAGGGGRPPISSSSQQSATVGFDRTLDRTMSCEQDCQQLGTKQQHSTRPYTTHNNHLPTQQQQHSLQWKSAENIFLSSTGGRLINPAMEGDDEGVRGDTSGTNHQRLVSSVSAYPLPSTSTPQPTSLATHTTASNLTISSTSSSSSGSMNSSSHISVQHQQQQPQHQQQQQQQQLSQQQQQPSPHVASNITNPVGSHEHFVSSHSHLGTDITSSGIPNASTPADSGGCVPHTGGGVTPLDLSGIPPITHVTLPTPTENGEGKFSHSPVPSPKPSPTLVMRETSCDSSDDRVNKFEGSGIISREGSVDRSFAETSTELTNDKLPDSVSRSSESCRSVDVPRTPEINSSINGLAPKERKESRDSKSGDKKSNKAWYKMLNPTYKSRSEDLKRLFKDLPSDERLIVDYSCALQKDILVHGRLYVTPNYFCFYSKIFGWETFVSIKCKDIVAMTKEKTALVIPNAVEVRTDGEKHFFTSFASRDKTYLMLFRIWQNALMDQQMSATELWQWVHSSYGDELGLTSDDDDYVAPSTEDDVKTTASSTPLPYCHPPILAPAVPKLLSVDSIDFSCHHSPVSSPVTTHLSVLLSSLPCLVFFPCLRSSLFITSLSCVLPLSPLHHLIFTVTIPLRTISSPMALSKVVAAQLSLLLSLGAVTEPTNPPTN
ncbi:hypothetical protein Pmani_011394 [Petrolisthes manimaculis]|uniref:GRAM domain-containing protein n=1 Tax=Petrolisthes manimaculis TaxID=1843537 RepID=A0AAE1PZM5_9EUCA|nr:hypothetical protein Pmani_011394 [Petrolisthes manimaculis]